MFSGMVSKTREFIVEEKDVTMVLDVINKHRKTFNLYVGNCGWADTPNKWFISFDAKDKNYGKIINELNEMGTFKLDVRPKGQVDLWFTRKDES